MKNYVVYFAGGTMTGVFGAGVATAFQEHNFYPNIRSIYATSAGIMTGAYFLARQTAYGATIYWEDLPDHFIKKKDFFVGVWQRFQDEFIKHVPFETLRDALDIDYAMSVVREKKRLEIEKILAQSIPLYVKFFNLDAHQIEYLDARRQDIYDILEMGISPFPYVHKLKNIDGRRYVDAGIMEILGINELLLRHPEDTIIVVLNRNQHTSLYYRIKNTLEGKFMQWMFDDPTLYRLYAVAEEKLQQDLIEVDSNPRVIILAPSSRFRIQSRTDDPKSLKDMYKMGIIAGQEMLRTLPAMQI